MVSDDPDCAEPQQNKQKGINKNMLSEQRKGEIAIALLKYDIKKRGVRLLPENKRQFGQVSKETGVPVDELKKFMKPIAQEILDEFFDDDSGKKK